MELSQFKWVDKYLLRYTPASILGAFLLAYAYLKRRELGIGANLDLGKFELATVFITGGFLLAYIASAPILVMHFSRGLWLTRKTQKRASIASTALMLAIVIATSWCLASNGLDLGLSLIASGAVAVWGLSMVAAYMAYFRRERTYRFYKQISAKRTAANDADFVETYRTLREHGNAFFIMFLELLLSVLIFATIKLYVISDFEGTMIALFLLTFLWITPAVVAWHVATQLETDFADE